jgi:hypothetical protein
VGFEQLICGIERVGEHKIGWEEKGNKKKWKKRGRICDRIEWGRTETRTRRRI